jgi:hypothetical protein
MDFPGIKQDDAAFHIYMKMSAHFRDDAEELELSGEDLHIARKYRVMAVELCKLARTHSGAYR